MGLARTLICMHAVAGGQGRAKLFERQYSAEVGESKQRRNQDDLADAVCELTDTANTIVCKLTA